MAVRSAQAGFALAVVRTRKQHEQSSDESQNEPSFQFPFQSAIQAPYNRSIASEITNSLAAPRGWDCKNLGFRHHSRQKRRSLDRPRGRIGGAQPEVGEVIVVNDQSTDRTGAILAELAPRIPKLK